MIGPMILSKVQIAATPIVPAPMKRTLLRNTSLTKAARSGAAPVPAAVSHGTSTTQLISSPMNIAIPTAIPTRWPTPISAIDMLVDMVVAPAPRRNVVAASAATSLVWARIA